MSNMVQPNQPRIISATDCAQPLKASRKVVRRTQETLGQTIRDIPDSMVSTARIIISAEEKLRGRLRSILRVALATIFFGISSLISLGANVTLAFAKKVSPETTRLKRTKNHLKVKSYRHSGKLHYRMNSHQSAGLQGMASWYGKQFHNQVTASGARFNTQAMTAAHRSLPFGTKVRVTNLQNNKSCVVEITDRGPFAHHRIIDLSYAAAQSIGMAERGTAEVELQVLDTAPLFQDIALESANEHMLSTSKDKPVFDRIPSFPNRMFASTLTGHMPADQDENH